jgi:hypothetical protein
MMLANATSVTPKERDASILQWDKPASGLFRQLESQVSRGNCLGHDQSSFLPANLVTGIGPEREEPEELCLPYLLPDGRKRGANASFVEDATIFP